MDRHQNQSAEAQKECRFLIPKRTIQRPVGLCRNLELPRSNNYGLGSLESVFYCTFIKSPPPSPLAALPVETILWLAILLESPEE